MPFLPLLPSSLAKGTSCRPDVEGISVVDVVVDLVDRDGLPAVDPHEGGEGHVVVRPGCECRTLHAPAQVVDVPIDPVAFQPRRSGWIESPANVLPEYGDRHPVRWVRELRRRCAGRKGDSAERIRVVRGLDPSTGAHLASCPLMSGIRIQRHES